VTPRYFISLTHGNKTPDEEQVRIQVTSLRGPILMQEDLLEFITKSRAYIQLSLNLYPKLPKMSKCLRLSDI